MSEIQIHESWKKRLAEDFKSDYMRDLKQFLVDEIKSNKTIYPKGSDIFSAFNETPFEKVKVVILGQDPYHGPGQAHGMSFSVLPGVKIPPSLQNIYKELESDLNIKKPNHGFLLSWAKQGVLLLNNVLTVEATKAGSHQKKGWEHFTDSVIKKLNEEREGLVFLLWGSPAQKKASVVDPERHLVLKSPHPSPLAAYRGFWGCRHFSKANNYLQSKGLEPIYWELENQ